MTGIAPTPDIFDAPGISICLNSEWASFIDAQVARLTDRTLWGGTEADVDRAVDQIEQFLAKLGDVGACSMVPIGVTMMWWTNTAPEGWLFMGETVSKTTYPELFDIFGYTYGGAGDLFAIPDMENRSPMGAGSFIALGGHLGAATHILNSGENGPHTHGVTDPGHNHGQDASGSDAYFSTGGAGRVGYGQVTTASLSRVVTDSAVTGISINQSAGGNPHNNVHPVTGCNFIIYAGH